MALKQFRVGKTQNEVVDRALQDVKATVDSILAVPLLRGVTGTVNIQFAGISYRVNHGLKRIPTGWIVTGLTTNAVIWSEKRTDTYIEFISSAQTVLDVIIY